MAFVRVAALSDVKPDQGLRVEIGQDEIALFLIEGTVYAIDNVCTHEYAWLADGFVMMPECLISCPAHGAEFDIRTGAVRSLPATESVRAFPVRIEGDDVLVDISTTL